MASGMRQLAGTRTRYRRADAAPLAGLQIGDLRIIQEVSHRGDGIGIMAPCF